jgi:phosphoesterase RecJ-like protein
VDARAFLGAIAGRRALWLLHVNADPDCVGAAYALQEAFGGVVGSPDGPSKAGAALARRLGLAIDAWPHPHQFEAVVAVDTSSRAQLGRLAALAGAPLLVDHHRYGDLQAGAPAAAWDPAASSCCEVVLDLLDQAGRAPSPQAAFGLLVGLVTDTARFRHATPATLANAARLLLASGATMEDALALLDADEEEDDSFSRRNATLLAATRARVEPLGDLLLATSEVSAFDAAAAGALVRCGADVALVASERSDAARMSLRASPRALQRGLHLGEVANEAARAVGWSGGGHEGAAGLSGKPPVAPARDAVLRLARGRLG